MPFSSKLYFPADIKLFKYTKLHIAATEKLPKKYVQFLKSYNKTNISGGFGAREGVIIGGKLLVVIRRELDPINHPIIQPRPRHFHSNKYQHFEFSE